MNTLLSGKHVLAGRLPNAASHFLNPVTLCVASMLYLLAMIDVAMAADTNSNSNSSTVIDYQSAFEGYKPLTNDDLVDWRATSQGVPAAGHADHTMHDAQHSMHHEEMGDGAMKATSKNGEMPKVSDMPGMDHSDMPHSPMHHDHTMVPMPGMEHEDKTGGSHAH